MGQAQTRAARDDMLHECTRHRPIGHLVIFDCLVEIKNTDLYWGIFDNLHLSHYIFDTSEAIAIFFKIANFPYIYTIFSFLDAERAWTHC